MKRKIDKIIDNFCGYLVSKDFSKDSIRSYRSCLMIFLKSNPHAQSYSYQEVLSFFDYKPYRVQSDGYRKSLLSSIKKYYDYLLETGQREDHPCHSLLLKGNVKKAIIHSDLFSMIELESLLNREDTFLKVRLKNQVVISLLIYQGLMPGEIVRLRVQDIDFDAGTVKVRSGRVLTDRTLELHVKQINILYKYINEARDKLAVVDTDQLIINYRGLPDRNNESINFLISTFQAAFPGRHLTTKTIRDSVIAYWLNERKLPLAQVQLMAGHRWISCTERYVQASMEEQRETLKKFHPLG